MLTPRVRPRFMNILNATQGNILIPFLKSINVGSLRIAYYATVCNLLSRQLLTLGNDLYSCSNESTTKYLSCMISVL